MINTENGDFTTDKPEAKIQLIKHDWFGFLCSVKVFIWRINLWRTTESFEKLAAAFEFSLVKSLLLYKLPVYW